MMAYLAERGAQGRYLLSFEDCIDRPDVKRQPARVDLEAGHRFRHIDGVDVERGRNVDARHGQVSMRRDHAAAGVARGIDSASDYWPMQLLVARERATTTEASPATRSTFSTASGRGEPHAPTLTASVGPGKPNRRLPRLRPRLSIPSVYARAARGAPSRGQRADHPLQEHCRLGRTDGAGHCAASDRRARARSHLGAGGLTGMVAPACA